MNHVTTYRPVRSAGIWLIALGASFWGLEGVLRTPLTEQFSAMQVVFLEHLLLVLFALPMVLFNWRQLQGLNRLDWLSVLFVAWGSSGIATVLFTAAFHHGNASVVLLLQKLQPLFVLLFARWLLKERLPRGFGFELVVALFGTYLLTFGFALPFDGLHAGVQLGSLLSIGAALVWGAGTVFGRHLLKKMDDGMLTGVRFLFTLPLMAVLVALEQPDWTNLFRHAFTTDAFWMFVYLVLFAGLLSMLLYYKGLATTKASYATLAELSFPAVGVLLNWLLLGQALSAGQIAGFAIIWWVVFRVSKRAG